MPRKKKEPPEEARELTPAQRNLLRFFEIYLESVGSVDEVISEFDLYPPHPDPNDHK